MGYNKRHDAKTDANQAIIVEAFEALGARVHDSSGAGGGFPDLTVQYREPMRGRLRTYLVEVKNPARPKSQRKLNDLQVEFHEKFNCHIVETVEDVYELLEITYQD